MTDFDNLDSSSGIFLTPDGYERLRKEMEHLTAVKRPEIADRIRESQGHGEFSEDNSELDEVKFEQALVENRIHELKEIFSSASTLDLEHIPTDRAGLGTLITVTDLQFHDQFEIRLVCSVESDPSIDYLSNESPLGIALYGRRPGDEVIFEAPEGRKKFRIDSIGR